MDEVSGPVTEYWTGGKSGKSYMGTGGDEGMKQKDRAARRQGWENEGKGAEGKWATRVEGHDGRGYQGRWCSSEG